MLGDDDGLLLAWVRVEVVAWAVRGQLGWRERLGALEVRTRVAW